MQELDDISLDYGPWSRDFIMLISEFARAAGLSVDTVRFYVRRGLLRPETGRKGGSNPYQEFREAHVDAARLIRMSQTLGFSLREIGAMAAEYYGGGMTPERSREIMADQLARLEQKSSELNAMLGYIRAKLDWIDGGQMGDEPSFGRHAPCGALETPVAGEEAVHGLVSA
jgi:DNA-binding transcriptional MerR regulator